MQSKEYKGACPPRGANHRYIFTLYALDTALNLSTDANAASVIQAMQGHVIDTAILLTTFKH